MVHLLASGQVAKPLSENLTPPMGRGPFSDQLADQLVDVFKLLSDTTRLKVLLTLWELGESHVRGLCDRLGQSQPAVSHHLALLRDAGLIDRRREGKHNFYYLVPRDPHQLLDVILSRVPDQASIANFRRLLGA